MYALLSLFPLHHDKRLLSSSLLFTQSIHSRSPTQPSYSVIVMDPIKDALSNLKLKSKGSGDNLPSSATARSGTPTNASGGGPQKLAQFFGQQ